jgi:hypothetical protein
LLEKESPRRSYNPWLAVVLGIFLVTTIVLAIFLGIEKNKTMTTTTTLAPIMTTTTTTLAPITTTTTTPAGIVVHCFNLII